MLEARKAQEEARLRQMSEGAPKEPPKQWMVDQAFEELESSFWRWDMRALSAASTAQDYRQLRTAPLEIVAKWYLKSLIL